MSDTPTPHFQTPSEIIVVLDKEVMRLRAENAALRGHIAAISDAVESVQDWSGTRVGNAIDAAQKDAP